MDRGTIGAYRLSPGAAAVDNGIFLQRTVIQGAFMLRRLYDWVLELAEHKHAPRALGAVSFAESSFFPIPPDVMLIPMALTKRHKAFFYALICTIGSVLGGLFGYFIGAVLLDTVGQPIIALYNLENKMEDFSTLYNEWGFWIVFLAGFTPIPYKVFTIASGMTGLNLPGFVLASLISRGGRFFLVAGLLYFFGPTIRQFIDRYFGLVCLFGGILLVAGFLLLKYIF